MARRWDEAVGVVTPEAVPLQFSEANVGSRGVAFMIDTFVLGLTMVAVNFGISLIFADAVRRVLPEWVAITALVIVNFLMFFGYPILFETMMRGRTPGKAAMGLRVVTVEGAPVRFRHAAIRAALGLVDFALTSGVGAVLGALLSKRHQRLGDMVAGTVVLRERTATAPPQASHFTVPDGADSYAATIDPSGLSPRDYEVVREFLLRAHTLNADARGDLRQRLAKGMAAKLGHDIPPAVGAELFLYCLAARYQQRAQGADAHAVPLQQPPREPATGPADAPTRTAGDPPARAPADGGFTPPR